MLSKGNLTITTSLSSCTICKSWYLLVGRQLFKRDDGRTAMLGKFTADQEPIKQVLHDTWNGSELIGITLGAIDGACTMEVKPIEDARLTECMLTLRNLQTQMYAKTHSYATQPWTNLIHYTISERLLTCPLKIVYVLVDNYACFKHILKAPSFDWDYDTFQLLLLAHLMHLNQWLDYLIAKNTSTNF